VGGKGDVGYWGHTVGVRVGQQVVRARVGAAGMTIERMTDTQTERPL